MPPQVPALISTKVGSKSEKEKPFESSLIMVQTGSLYNKQTYGHKFFFLDTYHLKHPVTSDHG
jgi:hypothetical protein